MFNVTYEDVLNAYYDCRKHKRNTPSQLQFEINFEENCYDLYLDLKYKRYNISKSIYFIITKPKVREVFAANFRDRIVHHLLIKKLNPLFEQYFINNSFSCRIKKGTLYGAKTLQNDLKEITNNYTEDAYIFKGDFKGFFMSINKNILWNLLESFIKEKYLENDQDFVLWITKKIVMHCSQYNCEYHGNVKLKSRLEHSKSLFYQDNFHGIPIGNLSSQVFANFYLTSFDLYVKQNFEYYGRYVDDFYILSKDKNKILRFINNMQNFLKENLDITLHPNKKYLQHFSKGVKFIGSVIKFNRFYTNNSTIFNFKKSILKLNQIQNKDYDFYLRFRSTFNSYLGFLQHSNSYNIRKRLITLISQDICKKIIIDKNILKIILKYDYNRNNDY